MKTISISALLLALILVSVLSMRKERQAANAAGGASAAHQPVNPPAEVTALEPTPLTTSLAAAENAPTTRDSWEKELAELKALAIKDPDAALARLKRMPDKHEQKAAAKEVCLLVAAKEPDKAMTAAWELDLGKFANESAENTALERLATQWANLDLVKAFAWASALPPDDEGRRDHVVKGIAAAVSEVTPAEAARLVTDHIPPDSNVRIDALMEILRQWATQDYAGAVAWASKFPEGPLRDRGIDELSSVSPGQPPAPPKPK